MHRLQLGFRGELINLDLIACDDLAEELFAFTVVPLQKSQCCPHVFVFVFECEILQHSAGTQLIKYFVAILCNKHQNIYRKCLSHLLHEVVLDKRWLPTLLVTMEGSYCWKIYNTNMYHLFAHDIQLIQETQLAMNFDQYYILCI